VVEGMYSDVSERRRLEEQLRNAQRMQALAQLTGGITHEFNNLLTVVLSNTQFLLDALELHDPRRDDALEVHAAAERAAELTRQLIAFSRRQLLAPTVVDLSAFLAGVERRLARLVGPRVRLEVRPPDGPATVRVDLGQLEQVLANLATNARDAMPDGGRLRIGVDELTLDASAAGPLGLSPGDHVQITVEDEGCGMDEATVRRAFEPFFTTRPAGEATGLGLATCHGIVTQSGGAIRCTSTVGVGTRFEILLPTALEEDLAIPEPADRIGAALVLVVEETPQARSSVRRMLRRLGYRAAFASSAEEAAEIVAREPVDLVLSDVALPPIAPDALARRVRELGQVPPVLQVAAASDAAPGALVRPFTMDALAAALQGVLHAR
jgi:two-component system, cell cycle sensor histidine kinase and response regulator CckA